MNDPRDILEQQLLQKIEEVYANSGLGKWFGKGGGGSSSGGGWDRYNTSGKKIGKCGDAAKGSSYSACLGKKYVARLRSKNGKEAVANWVKRKKAAQNKHGRGKKGSSSKGNSPIAVKYTNEEIMDKLSNNKNLQEMNYTGAVGIHEFMAFYNKATAEEEKQMQHCMQNNNVECVKSLITRVTGMEMDKIKETTDAYGEYVKMANKVIEKLKRIQAVGKSKSDIKDIVTKSTVDSILIGLGDRHPEITQQLENLLKSAFTWQDLVRIHGKKRIDMNNWTDTSINENLSEGWKDLAAAAAIGLGSLTGTSAADNAPTAKITQTTSKTGESSLLNKKTSDYIAHWEGSKDVVYKDSEGKPTIGIGHYLNNSQEDKNLFKTLFGDAIDYDKILNGQQKLSSNQIEKLFNVDVKIKEKLAAKKIGNFSNLPTSVKNAIINALYRGDLGPKTIAFMNSGNWNLVAKEYLNHKNAKSGPEQIKRRMNTNALAFAQFAKDKV